MIRKKEIYIRRILISSQGQAAAELSLQSMETTISSGNRSKKLKFPSSTDDTARRPFPDEHSSTSPLRRFLSPSFLLSLPFTSDWDFGYLDPLLVSMALFSLFLTRPPSPQF